MKIILDAKNLIIGLVLGVITIMTILTTTKQLQLSAGKIGRYNITGTEHYGFIVTL